MDHLEQETLNNKYPQNNNRKKNKNEKETLSTRSARSALSTRPSNTDREGGGSTKSIRKSGQHGQYGEHRGLLVESSYVPCFTGGQQNL